MGVTTVIKDYGTEILNAIRENDIKALSGILEKNLKADHKIAKLFVTDIKHRPSKKFACPLILAARQEDPRIINYMLVKGTDPNFIHHTIYSSKRREIITALHISADLGFYDTVETLLNANADCNIADHNQETALHIAVKKADRVMVRMMLSRGADPNIVDRRGNAALHIATLYGHLQMVRALLKYDADVYQQGQWGAIPPQIAAKEGHIHLIQLFCSRDVGNINIKIGCYPDKREKAPLHLAAEHGHVQTVLTLLDQFEAEVNLKDSDDNTPLHCVVLNPYDPHRMCDEKYFTESARVLIKNRVSINEKNSFGDSALHFAAMHHFRHIVELLLAVGANPLAENHQRYKPIDVVPKSDAVTKQLLKNAMLNPKPPVNASTLTLHKIGDLSFAQMPGQPGGTMGTLREDGGPFQTSTMRSNDPNNGNLFPRGDPQNFSFRSIGSMSSVYVEEVNKQRMLAEQRKNRHGEQGPESMDLGLGPSHSGSSGSQAQPGQDGDGKNVYHQIDHENEIPVYTKVEKDKKSKPGSKSQQESSQDTLRSMTREEIMKGGPATIHAVNPWEQSSMMSSVTDDASFEMQDPNHNYQTNAKNKMNRRKQAIQLQQKEAYIEEDSNATEDVFQEQFQEHEPSRKSKSRKDRKNRKDDRYKDEQIYQNVTVQPQQRRNKKEDRADKPLPPEPQEVQPYLPPKGVHIQHPRHKPGTIEVQYSGGPITISVDTMMDDGFENLPPGVGMGPLPPGLAGPKTPILKEITAADDGEIDAKARKEKKKKRKEKERERRERERQETIYANQDMLMQQKHAKIKSKKHSHKVPKEEYEEELYDDLPPPLPHKNRDQKKGRYLYQNDVDEENNELDQYVNADNTYEKEGSHYMNVAGRYGKAQESDEEESDEDESDEDENGEMGEQYVGMQGGSPNKPDVSGVINGTLNLNETDTQSEYSIETQPEPEEVRKTIKQKIEDMTGVYKKKWKEEEEKSIELPASWKDNTAEESVEELQPETPSKKKKKKKEKKHKSKGKEPEYSKEQLDEEFIDEEPHGHLMEDDEEEDDAVSPQFRTFAEKKRLFAAMLANQHNESSSSIDRPEKPTPAPRPKPAPRGSIQHKLVSSSENENWKVNKGSSSTVIESTGIFAQHTPKSQDAHNLSSQSEDSDADSESSSSEEEDSILNLAKAHPQPAHEEYYSITPELDAEEASSDTSSAQDTVINFIPNETRATEIHQEIKMERVRVVVKDVRHSAPHPYEDKPFEEDRSNSSYLNDNQKKGGSMDQLRSKPPPHGIVSPVNFKDILAMKSPPHSAGSMSPSSFISDGSQSRLNMRVAGNVPKAYTRGQKDSARRAFIKAAPVGIESGSEASDTEGLSGSRGSLTRNSRTSLTETNAPNPTEEGIRRHNEWNEPLQPINGQTKHPLSPQPTSPPTSPIDYAENGEKKAKLIGSYAKPYISFGKIETKTDLIDEYMQDIPEEGTGEYDPMRTQSGKGPSQFNSPHQQDITLGLAGASQAQVVKPHAVKITQYGNDTNMVPGSPVKQSSEERSSPVNASNQSAFSLVNQEMQYTDEDVGAISPTPSNGKVRSPKTVSIREENVNERGEKVETITTTITTGNAAQAITITAQDILVDEDDDDDYFDDDSFDEDQELEDYDEEPGYKHGKKAKRPTEKPPAPPGPKPVAVQFATHQEEEEEHLVKPSEIKRKIKTAQEAQDEHGLHPSLFQNMDSFNQDENRRRGRLQSIPPRPKLPAGYEKQSPENQSQHHSYSSPPQESVQIKGEVIGGAMNRQLMHPVIVELPETQDTEVISESVEYHEHPDSDTDDEQQPKEQKSFGPEDEEVAEISAAADAKRIARKEKRRKKKEKEATATTQLAEQQINEHQVPDNQQHLQPYTHSQIPSQYNEPYNPGKAQPGPLGTTIFIDGAAEVTLLNSQGKQVGAKGKGASKKKKKKDKKDRKKDKSNQPITSQAIVSDVWKEAMEGHPLASSETHDQYGNPQNQPIPEMLSPGSPEEHGIHGTVMGSNIERDDTVKKGRAGAYAQLKRPTKAESLESLDEDSFIEDQQRNAQEQALLAAQGHLAKPTPNKMGKHATGMAPTTEQGQVDQHYGQKHPWNKREQQQYMTHHETNLDDDLDPMPSGDKTHGSEKYNQYHSGPYSNKPNVPGVHTATAETNIDDVLPIQTPRDETRAQQQQPEPVDQGQQFQDAALGAIMAQQPQPKRQMGRRAARLAQGNQGAPAGFPGSRPPAQTANLWDEAQRKQQAFVDEERREQDSITQARVDVEAKFANIEEPEPMETEELQMPRRPDTQQPAEDSIPPNMPFTRTEPKRKSGGQKGNRYYETGNVDDLGTDTQQPQTASFEEAAMFQTQANLKNQQPHRAHKPRMAIEDDPEALSKMWKQRKDQEAEMNRVLQSMSGPGSIEVLDELPPGHQRPTVGEHKGQDKYGQGNLKGQRAAGQPPPGSPKPAKPPKPKKPTYLKNRADRAPGGDPNVQSLEDAAMQSISTDLQQQQPQGPPRRSTGQSPRAPGPQGFLPGTYKPPPPMYASQRSRSGSQTSQARPDDGQLVADLWAEQNKAEVVEMKPPAGHHAEGSPSREQHQGRPRQPKSDRHRGQRGHGQDPRRHHSSADVQSDSEAMRHKKKSISFGESPAGTGRRHRRSQGHHSETEMHNYEPPRATDPGKSLQEAALETIQAGLQDQKKISPRRSLPDKKRPINYTRGVYRPNPVTWRGSTGSRSASTGGGRYDDSQLISQLWAERSRTGNTDTEGEADTEDISGYHGDYSYPGDDSYMEGVQAEGQMLLGTPAGGQFPVGPPPSSTPEENKENLGGGPHHHPGHRPHHPPHGPAGLPPVPQSPRRVTIQDQARKRKKKRRHEKPDVAPQTEPGPVDFSKYSDTARLWMEQVDQNTVKKSKTMYLSVMPEGKALPDEFQKRVPGGKEGEPADASHQWVIARGRSIRRQKRKLEEAARRRSSQGGASDYNTSGAESDWEPDRPMSPGRQMLIFFRVGGNWRDLAWVLFDGLQSDSETIRLIKDVELKHPEQLTDQVHDLMHRWWKKKGSEATIEELQRALELVNMIYVHEEYFHQGNTTRPSVTSYTESEDDLDISQIEEGDPDVSRLIQEYQVRSLNASFDVSSAALKQHLLENHPGVKADQLSKHLYGTGLVETGTVSAKINRDRIESNRDSLGKKSRSSSGFPDASQDPLDYDSDTARKHSFVIVQPQLKSEDYKHETAI